jgi:basic membrane lipoprotein Med (substrate-binding protein (PBP1-ABC) superfamily)
MTDPRIGTELAGYRIVSLLGRGGMSVVYLAEQAFPERKVALKLLASDLAEDAAFRDRFVRESNAAASIDHPNIIPIYGAGEADGVLYIAMRYVEGTDLERQLDEHGPLDPIHAASIVSQAAGALDTAHERGLVHRDVKPGNLLLARASGSGSLEHVYVSDFGLIKRPGMDRDLTRSGQIMGSVDYIAPEQIQGLPVDGRADVYSLACVLYECLTGSAPFQGDMDVAVLWAHVHEDPPLVSARRPELPAGLDRVLARAMAKSPEDRYDTCGDLAAAVRSELGVATGELQVVPPRRGRSRRRLVAAGVAAVAVAAAAILLVRGSGSAGRSDVTGCEVAWPPRLHDRAFNESIYDGLAKAATELGASAKARVAKSFSPKDIDATIRGFLDQRCSLIVTLGAFSEEKTVEEARHNPDQDFVLGDPFNPHSLPNLMSIVFRPQEAAFLAGYLAAGVTKTGTVGTFGGIPIKTVTPFMNGFAAGVLKYNLDTGDHVRLVGWDPTAQTGSFISQDPTNFSAFGDPATATKVAASLVARGADVILPAAGGAGTVGGGRAALAAGGVLLIGVDVDQFYSSPEYANLWLTSVRKRYDVTVEDAMRLVADGRFKGGVLVGSLRNNGVDLAPFHDLSSRVPQSLKSRLQELRSLVIDGSVSVDPKDYLK